jgi:hypothetical protein
MRFCSRIPSNPLRLLGLRGVAMKSDPLRPGKNPGRDF